MSPTHCLGEFLDCGQDRRLKVQLRTVCTVYVDTDTVEGTFDGFLGTTVKHFITNGSSVRVPGDENQLRGGTAVIGSEIQIDQTITALIVREVVTEVIIGSTTFGILFDLDRLFVYNLVNVVTVLESFSLDLETLEV